MKINMQKEKSQIRIGIILNYINMILGNLIPVFYTPIMLSILGQQEYGLYKLSSSVTSYLSLISIGLGSAIIRYLIKAREEEGKEAEENILGLFVIIFKIIAVATFIIGIVLISSIHIWYGESLKFDELSRMKVLMFLMVCNMVVNFAMSPYLSVVNAHEKFVFIQCMNILTTCIGPLLNIVALYLGYASIGMAVVTMIITIVVSLMYRIYIKQNLKIQPKYKKMPRRLLNDIMAFSFWNFVGSVVGQLYNATDTVMIGAIPSLGTVGVAIYNVGGTFNNIVFSLTIGVSSLLGPKTNKMVFAGASNSELTDLAIKVGRLQGYIISLLVTGFIAFGKPFIELYAGAGYEDAYWVAVLMMVPNMIPLVQSVCLSIIVAKNRHKFRSLVYLGIAIVNVIGTWIMMKFWGIIGAALVTGIAVIMGQGLVMNWYYWKKTGLEIGRFWKQVGKIYIIPACMCLITLIIGQWVDFYCIGYMFIGIIDYTLIYCFLNWHFVFNEYEKSLINEPISKFTREN